MTQFYPGFYQTRAGYPAEIQRVSIDSEPFPFKGYILKAGADGMPIRVPTEWSYDRAAIFSSSLDPSSALVAILSKSGFDDLVAAVFPSTITKISYYLEPIYTVTNNGMPAAVIGTEEVENMVKGYVGYVSGHDSLDIPLRWGADGTADGKEDFAIDLSVTVSSRQHWDAVAKLAAINGSSTTD